MGTGISYLSDRNKTIPLSSSSQEDVLFWPHFTMVCIQLSRGIICIVNRVAEMQLHLRILQAKKNFGQTLKPVIVKSYEKS